MLPAIHRMLGCPLNGRPGSFLQTTNRTRFPLLISAVILIHNKGDTQYSTQVRLRLHRHSFDLAMNSFETLWITTSRVRMILRRIASEYNKKLKRLYWNSFEVARNYSLSSGDRVPEAATKTVQITISIFHKINSV
jgi:hypothetical protein